MGWVVPLVAAGISAAGSMAGGLLGGSKQGNNQENYEDSANNALLVENILGQQRMAMGIDQINKYNKLLDRSVEMYEDQYNKQENDRQRYYDIWGDVEKHQADVANSGLDLQLQSQKLAVEQQQRLAPLQQEEINAEMDRLGRRSLYYPLEEESIKSGMDTFKMEQEQRSRYRDQVYPLQDAFVKSIQEMDPDAYAHRASFDTASSYQKARAEQEAEMTRMGIDPGSSQFWNTNAAAAVNQAANMGLAATQGYIQGQREQDNRILQASQMMQPQSAYGIQAAGGRMGQNYGVASDNYNAPGIGASMAQLSGSYMNNASPYQTNYSPLLSYGTQNIASYGDTLRNQERMYSGEYSDSTSTAQKSGSDMAGGIGNAIGLGLKAFSMFK